MWSFLSGCQDDRMENVVEQIAVLRRVGVKYIDISIFLTCSDSDIALKRFQGMPVRIVSNIPVASRKYNTFYKLTWQYYFMWETVFLTWNYRYAVFLEDDLVPAVIPEAVSMWWTRAVDGNKVARRGKCFPNTKLLIT